eukprot:scaffold104089_cov64-Phaeocystis_antarctica.AAC.3
MWESGAHGAVANLFKYTLQPVGECPNPFQATSCKGLAVDLNGGAVTAIRVEGNELYIADYDDSRVVVLQLAGSEA